MNYERITSASRYDSHPRKVHIISSPKAAQTLCRKPVRSWWRQVTTDTGVLCAQCLLQMSSRNGNADAVELQPNADASNHTWALLDKVGYKLALSPRQYQICVAMKSGHLWPKQITDATGIANQVVRAQLAQLCAKHDITTEELRLIVPHVALTDPSTKRRRPTVYQRCGSHVAVYAKNGKEILIGCWDNRDDAVAGWLAWVAGRPFPVPPNKRGSKPYIRKQGNRYHPFLYDKANKKQIYICSCKSYEEALAAWQHAKEHGVYTSKGLVKIEQT